VNRTVLLLLALAAAPGCGDNIGGTETFHMCLINALENCEARTACGLDEGLDAARCPDELYKRCCADHDGCEGSLPITEEERCQCIDSIENTDCSVIEQGPVSIDVCMGW